MKVDEQLARFLVDVFSSNVVNNKWHIDQSLESDYNVLLLLWHQILFYLWFIIIYEQYNMVPHSVSLLSSSKPYPVNHRATEHNTVRLNKSFIYILK